MGETDNKVAANHAVKPSNCLRVHRNTMHTNKTPAINAGNLAAIRLSLNKDIDFATNQVNKLARLYVPSKSYTRHVRCNSLLQEYDKTHHTLVIFQYIAKPQLRKTKLLPQPLQ